MKLPFLTSFIVFLFILQHHIKKGRKIQEQQESAFWERESSANDVRRQSLDDLTFIPFQAEPFDPLTLLGTESCSEFLKRNPDIKDILSRLLFLEEQKIVNLTAYTNTDLKFKYGVANLPLLTQYDTNYNELITLLHNYAEILEKDFFYEQALTVLEYAISIGTDISATYMLCAKLYQETDQRNKLEYLKKEAEKISTSRKNSIVRKLQEFDLCNG